MSPRSLLAAIREVEAAHFRSVTDTGSTPQALTVWNALRGQADLPSIGKGDLPAWDGKRYATPAGSKLLAALQPVLASRKKP